MGVISVVIPTLNEAGRIGAVLAPLCDLPGVEVIVADGGSSDGTGDMARRFPVRLLNGLAGRAVQMNAGAAAATGTYLLFLHADTRLPEGFAGHVREVLARPDVAAGAFELRIDAPGHGLRLIERLANWRSRRLGMPYGDQAVFVRTALFREVGGFPSIPVMEDFELMRRLRRRGRVVIAPTAVVTSARRWRANGLLRNTLINQAVIAAYLLGVPPERIARWR